MPSPCFLDTLVRDFRYAVRNFSRDRRFVATAIFALALGVGASTVVFSVFYNLLFNAVAAKDAERLVVPMVADAERPESAHQLWVLWADVKYLREHSQAFERVIGSHSGVAKVQYGSQMNQFEIGHVWPDAFEMYGVTPTLGEELWRKTGSRGLRRFL
ncbi:MAG TPA: hypothetical protein VIX91_05875 [Candidatus Acidoferrum sp.]